MGVARDEEPGVCERLGLGECGKECLGKTPSLVLVPMTRLRDRVWVFTIPRMRLWDLRFWVPVLTSLGVDAEGLAVF